MDSGNIIVGSPGENSVYFWGLTTSGVVNQQIIVGPNNTMNFGNNVVMGGSNSLVVASSLNGNTGYIYSVVLTSTWVLGQSTSGGSQYGASVDVDDDGVAVVADLTQSVGVVQVFQLSSTGTWSSPVSLPCPSSPCPSGFGNEISLAPSFVLIAADAMQYFYSRQGTALTPILPTVIQNQQANDLDLPSDFFNLVGAIGAPLHGTSGAVFVFWAQCTNPGYYGQNCNVPCASSCVGGLCSNTLQGGGQCSSQPSPSSNINVPGAIGGAVAAFVVLVVVAVVLIWYFKGRALIQIN